MPMSRPTTAPPTRPPAVSPHSHRLSDYLTPPTNEPPTNEPSTPTAPLCRTDTGTLTNPTSTYRQAEAIRKVMLYTIVDSLDLTEEEEIWLGWQLDNIFADLATTTPTSVPLSARQEMLKGTYSTLLALRRDTFHPERSNASLYATNVSHATPRVWTTALTDVLRSSYNLTTKQELHYTQLFLNIFTKLGVGDTHNPRGSSYLPSTVPAPLPNTR